MSKVLLKSFSFLLAFLLCCFSFSCKKEEVQEIKEEQVVYDASVITLDVLSGNATLIKFPDVTILIDCGLGGEVGSKTVEKLKSYGVTDIDYFILSHMDENHIGATENILDNFNVKTAYVPDILDVLLDEYPLYKTHYEAIKNKIGVDNVKKNKVFEKITFENGLLFFLSPLDKTHKDSSYAKLFASLVPTEQQIDDVCPILYLSYKGVRFVISGDAGVSQEQIVNSYNSIGFYNKSLAKENAINLSEVDFWNLSSHGNDTGNSLEFINLLKPKNLLISVTSDNKGCPKTSVLENVLSARNDCEFYSTMLVGDICTHITDNGKYEVKTQKELQK